MELLTELFILVYVCMHIRVRSEVVSGPLKLELQAWGGDT